MITLGDWHVHTAFSSDSVSPLSAMIEQAISLGLSSICITDHNDYDYPEFDQDGNMLFQLDLLSYINTISAVKEQYADKIRIYTGIEQGLQPHLSEKINSFDSTHKLDFIIGSSHLIDHADPYYPKFWESHTNTESINRYFDYILENLRSCTNFDVYGHLDYVIRYAPNQDADYNWHMYADRIDTILKTLIEAGKGIEVNTGGLRYGLKETNPCYGILQRYHQLGGEIITIGSDAHKPEQMAFDFAKLPEILNTAGFRYYTIFEKRKPAFIKLST